MVTFKKHKHNNSSLKNQVVLYNLIFPLWVFPFIPRRIPLVFLVNFAVDAAIIWIYIKRHNKLNNPKIYCFMTGISERTNKPELNKGVVWGYSFKSAVFSYFADCLGGVLMVFLLEIAPFDRYIDNYHVWSNFVSSAAHVLIVIFIGFLVYLYHRHKGKRLNLSETESHGLGLIMGVLTAPWFFFIPTAWFY